MKLFDLIDNDLFHCHLRGKTLNLRHHPTEPLGILNYSKLATILQSFDDCTNQCRGLIYNLDTLEIVARPFAKFWNFNDERHPETLLENLPTEKPIMSTKFDGSLGVVYRATDGEMAVATRGSFESEQAEWATDYLQSHGATIWPTGWTPMVEIVYNDNRVVVRYDWEGLVLLTLVNIETGEEMDPERVEKLARLNNLQYAKPLHSKSLYDATQEDSDNAEGYIATWLRPGQSPLKVKIKFNTYVKMHRIVTEWTPLSIWQLLSEGGTLADKLDGLPQDFQQWALDTAVEFDNRRRAIYDGAVQIFGGFTGDLPLAGLDREQRKAFPGLTERANIERRKFVEFANQFPEARGLLFMILDGKNTTKALWSMVRPTSEEPEFASQTQNAIAA
jgi:RNA ligase